MLNQKFVPQPSFLNSYRHEFFKARKNPFFLSAAIMPLILSLVFGLALVLMRLLIGQPIEDKSSLYPTDISPYNLGTNGTFARIGSLLLNNISGLYTIVLILGCAMIVGNEYKIGTIKMLVTREPSRARLTLAKSLTAVTFVAIVAGAFLVSWLILSLLFKPLNNLPLEITADDWQAIEQITAFFTLKTLHTALLTLLVIAVAFRFKSVVAPVIVYFAYNGMDGFLSEMGARIHNFGIPAQTPDWLKVVNEIIKAICPFLLNTNFNRLTMAEQVYSYSPEARAMVLGANSKLVTSLAPAWSWTVIAAYVILFVGLGAWIFTRRDITD